MFFLAELVSARQYEVGTLQQVSAHVSQGLFFNVFSWAGQVNTLLSHKSFNAHNYFIAHEHIVQVILFLVLKYVAGCCGTRKIGIGKKKKKNPSGFHFYVLFFNKYVFVTVTVK